MSGGEGKVFPLVDEQRAAADPKDNVWLSASAGTGKTQVLSARVLRLLLRPEVDPSQILCLTFTKAGAAEMANRINAVLARWVRLDSATLAIELGYLGADITPEMQSRARTLFATVLDCPGGGLRIDTIHAFSQWLLASFPEEAGLVPGAEPMEDRTRELLSREVLGELLVECEKAGDQRLIDAVSQFSTVKDPGRLHQWLMRCAKADVAWMWEGPQGWQPPFDARLKRLIGLPSDADENWVAEALGPDVFPDHELRTMLPLMKDWSAQAGEKCCAFIEAWLACPPAERPGIVDGIFASLLTAEGAPRKMQKPSKVDPQLPDRLAAVADAVQAYAARAALLETAQFVTASLEIGRAFALRWAEAKRREGLLDFDDLIAKAARLLKYEASADWIRYKLDRRFDHVLIDEAQDTNSAQWDIIQALIDDFFSGEGAHGDRLRTIFTVGDYKQAIFGFQGTSPENFARAKQVVSRAIETARRNAEKMRANRPMPGWRDLDLGRSFRTTQPVLDFVNRTIADLGQQSFGLHQPVPPHEGRSGPGQVTLWNIVTSASALDDDEDGFGKDGGKEDDPDWLPAHETVLAEKIAEQVRAWLKPEAEGGDPLVLDNGGSPRLAGSGDIMVLVRRRAALASQVVAKLHARGVPVAGVDRLRLGAPLAVQDLMAALRFAVQPLDDLSLACLLGSPLIGWSQEDLLAHCPRDDNIALWRHLRQSTDPLVRQACDKLRGLLARADFETPQALLTWLLTGPWEGRRLLVERLGREANDPIDELINTAFAFETAHPVSLAGFIHWFDASTEELKRDTDDSAGQVRVMTVHGSKGLERPVVILADAAGEPGRPGELELPEIVPGSSDEDEPRKVPLPPLTKGSKQGCIAEAEEAAAARSMEEHWRLLYVAMTRAKEALFISGSLGPKRQKNGPNEDSWYARLEKLFEGEPIADPIWGSRREWGERADASAVLAGSDEPAAPPALPAWATTPIGPEPSPPRPLAPSAAGEDHGANPPLPPELARHAARRGVLIHRLLERLPDIAAESREQAAREWLERQAGDLPADDREEMRASAIAVVSEPEFAAIFSPAALAEVPIAATVNGVVIAGTADRLLVEPDRITVVDFKTTRRPPETLEEIPEATLKQMAAYIAALETIYPGREVRGAVLYTHAPRLFPLDPARIDARKREFVATQQSFAPLDVE